MWAGVKRDDLPKAWLVAEPLVEEALLRAHGEFDSRDIYCNLLKADWQLWLVGEASDKLGIVVTRVYELPNIKVCEIVLSTTGDNYKFASLKEEFFPVLKDWATSIGCDRIRASGRKGFEKVMGPGWKQIYIEVEYDLWAKAQAVAEAPAARQ